jgi:diadenosine tetraphosphate (Ap4A) HIT family hydrolase
MKYDKDNIFAKLIRGDIPCEKIYDDEHAIAFHDIDPLAPLHILVIPKNDFISFSDFMKKASPETISGFFKSVQNVIELFDLEKSGSRLISNCGEDGMQTVHHFHVHILGHKKLGGLL